MVSKMKNINQKKTTSASNSIEQVVVKQVVEKLDKLAELADKLTELHKRRDQVAKEIEIIESKLDTARKLNEN